MPFNTNRHARALRNQLVPKHYGTSPFQWGYVAGVHTRFTGSLHTSAVAGATSIVSNGNGAPNTMIIVGSGGPVMIESVTGTGPYTFQLAARGIPFAAAASAPIIYLATLDVYLDGWQNPPTNLPPGVGPILTTGVRYLESYTPKVGHVAFIARGTGLQKSDRVAIGRLA